MFRSLFTVATLALVASVAEGATLVVRCSNGTTQTFEGSFGEKRLCSIDDPESPEYIPPVLEAATVEMPATDSPIPSPVLTTVTDGPDDPEVIPVAAQNYGFPSANGGGDPHFQTWNGDFFSYHGACDLVLVHSPGFSNGKGLRLHIRTERRNMFSFISNAALQIGNDVLEVQSNGEYFVNGVANPTGNIWMSGYGVAKTNMDSCGNNVETCSKLSVALPGGVGSIELSTKYGVVFVSFKGHFPDSVGLLGSYDRPGMIARNPEINLTGYPDVFAQNWQVTSAEPMLFMVGREPQYPQKCLPALVSESRNLRGAISEEEAAKACAHVKGPKLQFCIYDLIATGDWNMVQDSFYTD